MNGFTYGELGDFHNLPQSPVVEEEGFQGEETREEAVPTEDLEDVSSQESDSIPLPPQFNTDGTGSKPPKEQ